MAGTSLAMTMEPRSDAGEKIAPAKIFFIIFVDGLFTTLFACLFTKVFNVIAPIAANSCVCRACNAD